VKVLSAEIKCTKTLRFATDIIVAQKVIVLYIPNMFFADNKLTGYEYIQN